MKKKLLFIPLFGMLLAGCSFDDLMFWKKSNTDTNQTNKEDQKPKEGEKEPENPEGEGQEGLKSFVIKTYGTDFDGILNDGGHISDRSDEFTTFLVNQSSSYNAITSVETENLHAREWNGDLYLQYGSGAEAIGYLTLNFTNKVYKIEAKVLCYSKTFIPGGQTEPITNVDSWSHFSINGSDNELSYDEEKGIEIFTFPYELTSGTNSITFASSMGRVLMKEFKIFYQ